ncbi:MAG: hypothetical protein H0V88_11080 [Pyrinomonadaceae bacterium]|nr:hypothetical protein [Pyrinomonadaceae bacterium]
MTDEELKNKMEFIVEQQAQFTAKIGILEDVVTRLANSTLRRFEKNEDGINDLDVKMTALVDAQINTENRMEELAGAQAALMATFERFINRENSKS